MPRISITAGEVAMSADLNESETAAIIAAALPIQATVNRWGDEIYFEIPVSAAAQADARQDEWPQRRIPALGAAPHGGSR